ncbi:hypothetical protein [Carboxylicivirga marina]|uniref:Uncharacterized protein n=1 Tax=Carboxylicivirga marina TaxID=2800988 RepID=A0ABS1HJY3_9BACT|nr:hypothetical protein [Carboxylicivirga marina]MBK3517983.1 hypothetical protein [Carboxylicivirga marina]
MSDSLLLNTEGIELLKERFLLDEHFQNIALPRLRLISAVKEQLSGFENLQWKVNYAPVNRSENSVSISLSDPRKKFNFHYVIPLSLRLSVHLYLGDNTFNFFEAYPVLLKNNVIKEDDYKVNATMNTLPHLIVNKGSDKYELELLRKENLLTTDVHQSNLYLLLKSAFERFNSSLFDIIIGTVQI